MIGIKNIASVLLLLAAPAFAHAADSGRDALLREKKELEVRIRELKREQDFLLFQKDQDCLDSKYLILNLSTRKGKLKYKTRVLKEFPITIPGERKSGPKQGQVVVTKKIDGPKRYGLIFGRDLILRGKNKLTSLEAVIPPLSLDKRDLMAIYYALEPGARAFILP